MQRLPFPHLVAQRYEHGELQAAVSGVVQNDVPDELHKKGFSTNELQKQLGLKRYEPVWAMVHKLRRAMGNRDARYTLEGMIELDEGYFSVASKEIERGKGTRGRGAEGKQNVAVMAESTPLEDIETGKRRSMCVISRPGYWIAIKVKESTAWSGTAWRMMPSYFRTKALLTLTSPIWWNCTSPRNQTPKPPRKHSNGCISQSVMQTDIAGQLP